MRNLLVLSILLGCGNPLDTEKTTDVDVVDDGDKEQNEKPEHDAGTLTVSDAGTETDAETAELEGRHYLVTRKAVGDCPADEATRAEWNLVLTPGPAAYAARVEGFAYLPASATGGLFASDMTGSVWTSTNFLLKGQSTPGRATTIRGDLSFDFSSFTAKETAEGVEGCSWDLVGELYEK